MEDLQKIFLAEKEISHFPGWSAPEEGTSYIWFDAPLEIGGVTETGLVLHGGCFSNRPNCHVIMELRVAGSPGRKRLPLERLCWRSLEGGHSNRRRQGARLSGITVSDTHLHPFEDNWSEAEKRMRHGNLRMAMNIEENLETFQDVRDFMGKRLRIKNIEVVSEPDWMYDLFFGGP